MQGTYLQLLPKDLREKLIRFGGYWPSYIEKLPPDLKKALAPYIKGVWFRAHVIKEPLTEAILVLTDLVFIEPGKRTMTIDEIRIPVSMVKLPSRFRYGNADIRMTYYDIGVKRGNIEERYSLGIGELFSIKLYKAALDLAEQDMDVHHRAHARRAVEQTEGPYMFAALERMYEDIV